MKMLGLLPVFLSVMVAFGAHAQGTEQIHISLTSYAFAPAPIALKAGTTYRLHLTNDSTKEHNFTAAEFFAASMIASPDRTTLEDGKEVEVEPGKPIDITLTPTRAGTYQVTCSHFLHSMLGMKAAIIVK